MNRLLSDVNSILHHLHPSNIEELTFKRYGSKNDGGYVIVSDLRFDDFLLSFGVGNDVNFELDVLKVIAGAHLYDDSIVKLPMSVEKSKFFSERIGEDGGLSLSKVLARLVKFNDLILKIDIEGSEWDLLDLASSVELSNFRQIVVEFHWLHEIVNENFRIKVLRVLEKVNKTHCVINAHPNNWSDPLIIENLQIPNVIEVTFLRRDGSFKIEPVNKIKGGAETLNTPCHPDKPEIYLIDPINDGQLNLSSNSIGISSKFIQDELMQQRDELMQQRDELMGSTIWKLTRPLRNLINFFKK